MEKLKPCPWCGPVEQEFAHQFGFYFVQHFAHCPLFALMGDQFKNRNPEEQAEVWNTRTEPEGGYRG